MGDNALLRQYRLSNKKIWSQIWRTNSKVFGQLGPIHLQIVLAIIFAPGYPLEFDSNTIFPNILVIEPREFEDSSLLANFMLLEDGMNTTG